MVCDQGVGSPEDDRLCTVTDLIQQARGPAEPRCTIIETSDALKGPGKRDPLERAGQVEGRQDRRLVRVVRAQDENRRMGLKEARGALQAVGQEGRGGGRHPVFGKHRTHSFPAHLAEVQGSGESAFLEVIGDVIAQTAATRAEHGVMLSVEVGEGLGLGTRRGRSLIFFLDRGLDEFFDAHGHTNSIASVGQ